MLVVDIPQLEYAAGQIARALVLDDPGVWTDMLTADYVTGTSNTDVFQTDGPATPTNLTATTLANAIRFNATLPAYFAPGSVIELYEYTSSTPFSSATKIIEGHADTFIIGKRDNTLRYYWVRIRDQHGAVSGTYPPTNGVSAAADFALTSDINPDAISQRDFLSTPGPVTMSANGTVTSKSISPAADGELVIFTTFLVDQTNFTSGSYAYRLEIDHGGVSVPTHAWTSANTGSSNVQLLTGPARISVTAGTQTLRLQVLNWSATGSVDFSQITFDIVLLKR